MIAHDTTRPVRACPSPSAALARIPGAERHGRIAADAHAERCTRETDLDLDLTDLVVLGDHSADALADGLGQRVHHRRATLFRPQHCFGPRLGDLLDADVAHSGGDITFGNRDLHGSTSYCCLAIAVDAVPQREARFG